MRKDIYDVDIKCVLDDMIKNIEFMNNDIYEDIERCMICLDEYNEVIIDAGDNNKEIIKKECVYLNRMCDTCIFYAHDSCISQWYSNNNKCLICRKNIIRTEEDYNNEIREEMNNLAAISHILGYPHMLSRTITGLFYRRQIRNNDDDNQVNIDTINDTMRAIRGSNLNNRSIHIRRFSIIRATEKIFFVYGIFVTLCLYLILNGYELYSAYDSI